MNRRQLIRYSQASLLAALGTGIVSKFQSYQAQIPATKPTEEDKKIIPNDGLRVQWLGHTCFVFTGSDRTVLVNPFRPIGCTQGYRRPQVNADFVLITSRLLDEGVTESLSGNFKLLFEPGVYQFLGNQLNGIRIDKDREGGRRFGSNIAWRWIQGGINILHLGGVASPITLEQKILMVGPDLLLLPVGGGVKSYTPEEAKKVVLELNPKMVIPMHYRTQAADTNACDLVAVDEFLNLMGNQQNIIIRRADSDNMTINSASLPKNGSVIQVLSYKF